MYLDLIKAFDTVPQRKCTEILIHICVDLRTFTCFENCWKLQGYESGSNIKEKEGAWDNLTSFNSELIK